MSFSQLDFFKSSSRYSTSLYLNGQVQVFTTDTTLAAFIGRSKKPSCNFIFKSTEERDAYLVKFLERAEESIKRAQDWKQSRKEAQKQARLKFKEALKPGVILSDSWGYEQTQVEFYKVLSVKGSKITIQELGHIDVGARSWASCDVMPDEKSFVGEPITKTVLGSSVKINDSVSLTVWDGKPCYKSWYY